MCESTLGEELVLKHILSYYTRIFTLEKPMLIILFDTGPYYCIDHSHGAAILTFLPFKSISVTKPRLEGKHSSGSFFVQWILALIAVTGNMIKMMAV